MHVRTGGEPGSRLAYWYSSLRYDAVQVHWVCALESSSLYCDTLRADQWCPYRCSLCTGCMLGCIQ